MAAEKEKGLLPIAPVVVEAAPPGQEAQRNWHMRLRQVTNRNGMMSVYEISSLMFAAIDSALQESQSTSTQPSLFFLKALGDSVTVGGPLVPSSNSVRERIITDTCEELLVVGRCMGVGGCAGG